MNVKELTADEKKLILKIPSDKLEAYDYYLKGQFYWRKLAGKDFDISLKYYKLARENDPNFALAYANSYPGRNQEMTEAFLKVFSIQYKALIETVNFTGLIGDYRKKLQILVDSAINNLSKI